MTGINGRITSDRQVGSIRIIYISQLIAALIAPVALGMLAVLYLPVIAVQGRPFLYASERMRTSEKSFRLYKIRTMHPPISASEESVLSGHEARRVTRIGAFLRRTRLDELPQIYNVLKGEIRFIGPRPPLRRYVEAYPDIYSEVLCETPPGITGLATVTVHRREERILSACADPAEADRAYRERCIHVKARLDLIYRRRRGFWLNLAILLRTFSRLSVRGPQTLCRTTHVVRNGAFSVATSNTALHYRKFNPSRLPSLARYPEKKWNDRARPTARLDAAESRGKFQCSISSSGLPVDA